MRLKEASFLSVKSFNEYTEDFVMVRKQDLPLVSLINQYILDLEYQVGHEFTQQDFNELLGQDFALAWEPHFFFVSRTRKEYNVFYYLRTKADPVVQERDIEIRAKKIRGINRTIYYAFSGDFFFAADNLHRLKQVLRSGGKNALSKEIAGSRVILYDGNSNGFLKVFFNGTRTILWGDSIANLSFLGDEKKNDSFMDVNYPLTCNIRLFSGGFFSPPVYGKLMITGFNTINGNLSAGYKLLSPLDLKHKRRKIVEQFVLERLHSPSLPLTKRRTGRFLMYANDPEKPLLRDEGILFKLDLNAASSFPLFSPEFSALLKKSGIVSVRKER
jgi:hypothetical protein